MEFLFFFTKPKIYKREAYSAVQCMQQRVSIMKKYEKCLERRGAKLINNTRIELTMVECVTSVL